MSSRGLGLIFLFNSLFICLYLIKFKKIIYSKIIVLFLIIFSFFFYFKSIELLNIFYVKKLSVNQNYIYRENLFQKINFNLYKTIRTSQTNYLIYNYTGKGEKLSESSRWKEYKNFLINFKKKYIYGEKNIKFNNFYHNFYFNEIARFGLPAFFLISYLLSLVFSNLKSALDYKNSKNLYSSIIYILNFFYISIFDAFLSANIRNLILLIIILFILNNYNDRKTKKI